MDFETTGVPRSRLDAAIAHGPRHLAPIFIAMRDMGLGCSFLLLEDRRPFHHIDFSGRFVTLLIDGQERSRGPHAFDSESLRRLFRSAQATVIMPYPGYRFLYAGAVILALSMGHAVIVETTPDQELAWIDFVLKVQPDIRLIVGTDSIGFA